MISVDDRVSRLSPSLRHEFERRMRIADEIFRDKKQVTIDHAVDRVRRSRARKRGEVVVLVLSLSSLVLVLVGWLYDSTSASLLGLMAIPLAVLTANLGEGDVTLPARMSIDERWRADLAPGKRTPC